ncbi:MAG: hypothetical protein IIC56_07055 [Proteobacteria bacterium]|nr:hypothetical protein [Pseudomonadota bacterium]
MAKKPKPRSLGKRVPGEKKFPGHHDRLAQELRGNLHKRRGQAHTQILTRHSPRGK